jgi:hypothetical protein
MDVRFVALPGDATVLFEMTERADRFEQRRSQPLRVWVFR